MFFNSRIPIKIDVQTNNPIKKRNISVYYNDVIKTYNIKNDKDVPFNTLPIKDQEHIKGFCKKQFDSVKQNFWWNCFGVKRESITHKQIDPKIFSILDIIEGRILKSMTTEQMDKSDPIKNIFRLDDKGLSMSDINLESMRTTQLCTLVKSYILTSLDGLFSNLVSSKLVHSYFNNRKHYDVLISYIPFVLSADEYKLLTRLFEIFKLVDQHKEQTHMNMAGLLRLFSLVLFDSKSFNSIEVLLAIEKILNDIAKVDFQKIPETFIRMILRYV